MRESALVVTPSSSIRVESKGQNELLRATEAIMLESAEEHTVVAHENSVCAFDFISKRTNGCVVYRSLNEAGAATEDWKERIVPELRLLALEHEQPTYGNK